MILMFLTLFVTIAVPVCIGLFVYQDAKSHGMTAWLWTAVAVLIPYFVGLVIYLLVRYNNGGHRCHRCGAAVKDSYSVCPQCGTELKMACPGCGATIEPDWHVCAHCGTALPYYEPYNGYQPPATTGFDSKLLVKGLVIAGVITLVLAVLFALTAGFFISIPFQLNGMSIMHHI